ncbi:MAG: hypothetical protein U1F35_10115 [Steroidobacteraceae bacterium]
MNVALRALVLAALALTAGACTTLSPEEDPVQIKLNDMDNRLTRIEGGGQPGPVPARQ